jgi:hypothetical protein
VGVRRSPSPILFNIVVDMLDILINRAKDDGLILYLNDGRLSILQYADDALIFMDHNLEKAET